jgi:hypothetical protein
MLTHWNVGLLLETEDLGINRSAFSWSSTSTLARLILISIPPASNGTGAKAAGVKPDLAEPTAAPAMVAFVERARQGSENGSD